MGTTSIKESFSCENIIKKPLPLIRDGILNFYERHQIINSSTRLVYCSSDVINCKYANYANLDTCNDKDFYDSSIDDTDLTPWGILKNIKEKINEDFNLLSDRGALLEIPANIISNAIVIGDQNLIRTTGSNVLIYSGVVLDTTSGPIVLGDSVKIYPFTTLEGPLFINNNTEVKSARISGGVVIGKVCKISGEIYNSVIGDYSNKSHEGLVTNSFVGDWCNLGGYTNTASLKSDYSSVQIKCAKKTYDTQTNKFGAIIGNYVRIGGGISIMPGTFIDTCTTIVQWPIVKGYIKPFTRILPGIKFRLDDFVSEMESMMTRRNVLADKAINDYWKSLYDSL